MSTPKPDQEFVKEGAEKVTEKDIEKVVNKSEEIKKKFTGRSLGRFIEDAQLLISVVKDYWSGKYRQVPYGAVAAIVFTLIYVFNPLDLVPDILPIIGEVDDAAVVAACLMLVERDLYKYRDWKQNQSQS
jgi:uncharacterized membrane protein YkvA (DUF1232 family)